MQLPADRLPDRFKKAAEIYRLAEALSEPPNNPLLIVEGFFEAMRLWQLSVRKCLAFLGCSLSVGQETLLFEYLSPHSKFVVLFDQDDAGRIGREQILQRRSLRCSDDHWSVARNR